MVRAPSGVFNGSHSSQLDTFRRLVPGDPLNRFFKENYSPGINSSKRRVAFRYENKNTLMPSFDRFLLMSSTFFAVKSCMFDEVYKPLKMTTSLSTWALRRTIWHRGKYIIFNHTAVGVGVPYRPLRILFRYAKSYHPPKPRLAFLTASQ